MTEKLKILFVCTGNVFRSLSAEYCLKDYLKKHNIKNVIVESAGIICKKENPNPTTIKTLKDFGINISNHKQIKVNEKLLKKYDIIISMAQNHYDFLKENFNINSFFFNELVNGKKISVLDTDDVNVDIDKHIRKTINYVHKSIPLIFDNIIYFNLLFSNFINGNFNHKNGFPFMPLYETKYSIAFMSIDIPEKEDGHILVVPKKRYKNLEDIPQKLLNDLIKTISIIGQSLMLSHEGYNVLLNNGRSAGQYILHTHFHIIPRKLDDKIKIEV